MKNGDHRFKFSNVGEWQSHRIFDVCFCHDSYPHKAFIFNSHPCLCWLNQLTCLCQYCFEVQECLVITSRYCQNGAKMLLPIVISVFILKCLLQHIVTGLDFLDKKESMREVSFHNDTNKLLDSFASQLIQTTIRGTFTSESTLSSMVAFGFSGGEFCFGSCLFSWDTLKFSDV